jgi:hypothetical protein
MLAPSVGVPILTPSQSKPPPTPSRLENTALQLLDDGDVRTLVGFVEAWAEFADPTPKARLAQAEGFRRLRLMDKAWVRLKALIDRKEAGVEPHRQAARLFLDRGWPGKARKILQLAMELEPSDEGLSSLWDEASEADPPTVDTSAADDADASHEALVGVAEHFMSQGAFVRARSLLERIRRDDPTHRRAGDLLWALDGDFSLDEPLSDVVDRYAPDLSTLAELSDDGDHTESADLDTLPLQIERDNDSDRFPALFRHLEPTDPEQQPTEEGEVTAVTSLAEMQQLAALATEPREATEAGEDTQIMRVVHKAGGLEPVGDEAVHDGATQVDSSFNLADFRREMGMDVSVDSDLDFHSPESEDDSVVVVTRREEEQESLLETTGKGLTLDTEADARAAAVQGAYDEEGWANLGEEPEPTPEPEATPPTEPAPAPPPKARDRDRDRDRDLPPTQPVFSWPWWLAVLALVMAFGTVVFGLLSILLML